MVNNIRWKGPWEINSVEGKTGKNNALWLKLLGRECEECTIRLPSDKQILSVKGFYDLGESCTIDTIRVVPNKKLHLVVGEDSNYTNKREITILKVRIDLYHILISKQEIGTYGFASPYIDKTLNEEQLREKMKAFEPYLELFSFFLPLGKCFEVDEEE